MDGRTLRILRRARTARRNGAPNVNKEERGRPRGWGQALYARVAKYLDSRKPESLLILPLCILRGLCGGRYFKLNRG